MKTILYIGATLMIGASIYGFVDYKKTSRNKEFKNMYETKETTAPVTSTVESDELTIKPAIHSPANAETTIIQKENKKVKSEKSGKKKKFSYKLYSRAALEEKYIEKELQATTSKAENKKQQ
jgi:hypothetical protein